VKIFGVNLRIDELKKYQIGKLVTDTYDNIAKNISWVILSSFSASFYK